MATKKGSEIDSYLFHLIGDEETVAQNQEKIAAKQALTQDEVTEFGPGSPVTASEGLESVAQPEADSFAAAEDPAETSMPTYEQGIPILIQVRRLEWTGDHVAGFHRYSRVGDIVTGSASMSAIEELGKDPDVMRVDVSRDAGEEELDVSVPAVRADVVNRRASTDQGIHALVGIIDGGIDVLHEAFQDDNGKTRIVAVWDQRDSTGPAPKDDAGNALYGTLHTSADIDSYILSGVVPAGSRRDPSGHGTHVASIAAGRAAGGFSGGVAPKAGIVIVIPKINTPHGDPRSIGYSMSHVDALAFMDRIAIKEGKPIAVNISLGMNAGAHDGTSTLEAAFDNFTSSGRMPGRVLIKSAGNAAMQDLHANFQIGESQQIALKWNSWNTPRRADVIEVWYNSADDLAFTISAPNNAGTTPILDRDNNRDISRFANGNACSTTLDRFYRDNGDTRLVITITRGTAPGIAMGEWTLTARATEVLSVGTVDAWIERPRGRTINFVTDVARDGSLSIPGTANAVIAVAAVDRAMNGQVTNFSSRGGTRDGRPRPDVAAPGDGIVAARSGTTNGTVAKSGTSMAAPHVTGAIALLLSQQGRRGNPQLNANQIRAALAQSSGGFNGHWNSARGWGMLDVPALLSLF